MQNEHNFIIEKVNLNDLRDLADILSNYLLENEVISLVGDLGCGKTTFTKMLFHILGVKEIVDSASFSIAKTYNGSKLKLSHIDGYRLNHDSIREIEDYLDNRLVVIEWAENIFESFDYDYIIEFIYLSSKERKIKITSKKMIKELRKNEI